MRIYENWHFGGILIKIKSKKISLIFVVFLIALLWVAILNIAIGSVKIPLNDLLKVLSHKEGDVIYKRIVWDIRLPRTIAAIIGGASLAVSGLLMQILFRNPIVDPYVLGVSSGATLMVAIMMLGGLSLGFSVVPPYLLSVGAFTGSLMVVILIVTISAKVRQVVTLLVIGLMIGYMCGAGTTLLQAFAEKENLHKFVIWTMGSFSGFNWDQVYILSLVALVMLGIAYLISKPLNALLLGDDYAKSMGVNIKTLRVIMVLVASILTATVTAFAGPVAFIGLAAPHIARLLLGTSDNKVLIPGSVLLGAFITIMCDLVARVAFSPSELPISSISSFIGAPIVVGLLMKRRTSI